MFFMEQLSTGTIERVAESEYDNNEAYFLPHQQVVKTNAALFSTRRRKKRIIDFVWTITLKKDRINTISNIFDILINFRSKPVGATADIESAFLQIGIDPADREKLRFLWYENVNSVQPKLVQFRFCHLMFGLKPSSHIRKGRSRSSKFVWRERARNCKSVKQTVKLTT